MYRAIAIIVMMVSFIPLGIADPDKNETRIYQTDSIGTVNTSKQSYVIQEDGRVLPTDSIGTRDSGSQEQYKIIGDRIYETDSIGTVKHDKSMKIK